MNPSPPEGLAAPQRIHSSHLPELAALAIYSVVVSFAIHFHEPWADEAQAWEIARSLPLAGVFHVLRYEGSPGLWHLLLWCLNQLHVSYAGMHWFCGLIAIGAVAMLLFKVAFSTMAQAGHPFYVFSRLPIRCGGAQLCARTDPSLRSGSFMAKADCIGPSRSRSFWVSWQTQRSTWRCFPPALPLVTPLSFGACADAASHWLRAGLSWHLCCWGFFMQARS